jgi:hypothetical protein
MIQTINPSSWQRSPSATIALAVLALTVCGARVEAQIPAPWTYTDVGSVGIQGTATLSSNQVLTINAAGADIWGTADSFGYIYQPFVGDGYARVQVYGLQNTNAFAKAGLVLRESLDPSSPEVILDVRPTGDLEFMSRPTAGAPVTFIAGGATVGMTLELFREGSTVTAYAFGNTKTLVASTTISMGQSLLIGVAVTSHDVSTTTTATLGLPLVHNYTPRLPIRFMTNTDVGTVGQAGSASYADDTYTVSGAGADVWGTADAFHFVGTSPVDVLIGRVTSIENTDPFAKAGIDMRLGRGPSPSDSHVILDVRPTGDVEFMVRPKNGGETLYLAGTVQQLPVWLKLAVSGTTINGYFSSDGLDWTLVGTAQPDFADMNAGDGWISAGLVVTSHNTSVLNTSTFDNVAFIRNFNNLPEPWLNGDVGDTGATGSASWAAGTYTLQGSGADIWSTADAFQFLYQWFSGCCNQTSEYPLRHVEVSAHVTSVQNTNPFAKAGVMLRTANTSSLRGLFDASGADVILDVRPTGDVEFMARASEGGDTTYIGGTTVTGPVWLKLTRVDNVVTGYVSLDGTSWNEVGSTTTGVSIDTEQAGIVVTSHRPGTLTTATFDHVELRIPQ